ncbi:MAG TPA: glycosyl hydrolase 53 family protein [Polyangiaceae bacterium]|jgi:arabinogalactan endo-1,4-beta-galactosidase|nr:glycosyl hydrolase 53 family protein [Polyangiaceae bacterium]
MNSGDSGDSAGNPGGNVSAGGASTSVAGASSTSGGAGQTSSASGSTSSAGQTSGGSAAGGASGASSSAGNAGSAGRASGGTTGAAGSTQTTGGNGGAPGGGGQAAGGASGAAGSTGSAGSAGAASSATYFIGADITSVQAAEARGATYSDGTKKDIFQLLKDHGFNYIRLRTFVDPKAADGYDQTNGYADLAHTITFGKRIKAAGLGFLLDFHYSDNWADPGKQCVPIAWQGYTTIAQLATAVHDYTKDAITQLIAGGARPDMVQIGNEITPGMLINVCDSGGQPTGNNQVTGSISNWTNLGTLLKAGVQGVKDVDTGIKIMLHIDRGGDKGGYTGGALNTSESFITNAQKQGVAFDVFGESCYQAYQGDPNSTTNTKTDWTDTFTGLTTKFPNLKFVAAEYGPMQREINDVLFGLSNQQGLGTFNWEPTEQGAWNTGHSLFTAAGNTNTATADLALYDAMKTAYAGRL